MHAPVHNSKLHLPMSIPHTPLSLSAKGYLGLVEACNTKSPSDPQLFHFRGLPLGGHRHQDHSWGETEGEPKTCTQSEGE